MAKKVKEVLSEIQAKENTTNRFSKKNFNELMKAMLNDPEYAAKIAVVKGGELKEVQDTMVSNEFRKFLKKILEKAGIDKNESEVVMEESFTIDNVDGLYEFITAALYEYMAAGNNFEFPAREDFRGSISIKTKKATRREGEAHNPQTREYLGYWEYTTKPYKAITASSPCPSYLKGRRKLKD